MGNAFLECLDENFEKDPIEEINWVIPSVNSNKIPLFRIK